MCMIDVCEELQIFLYKWCVCVWCVAMLLSHIMCMRCVNVFNNDDDDEDDYTNANRIKLICSCVYKGEITSSKLLVL